MVCARTRTLPEIFLCCGFRVFALSCPPPTLPYALAPISSRSPHATITVSILHPFLGLGLVVVNRPQHPPPFRPPLLFRKIRDPFTVFKRKHYGQLPE